VWQFEDRIACTPNGKVAAPLFRESAQRDKLPAHEDLVLTQTATNTDVVGIYKTLGGVQEPVETKSLAMSSLQPRKEPQDDIE
jgi:hypothetical protein